MPTSLHADIVLARVLHRPAHMDRCQTILPPQPPALTTLRASLGALWGHVAGALRGAVRRASRPRIGALKAPGVPSFAAPVSNALASPVDAAQGTPDDDKWLRPTRSLPRRA